jgi:uncharacterized protein
LTAFFPGRAPIDAYGNGGFRFARLSHRGSILVLPGGIHAWRHSEELRPQDFAMVFDERAAIDVLLLGTGTEMLRPPPQVREAFAAHGLTLDFMSTGSAVRTYNILLAENRRVAAALIAVADAQ